jgi:hypothetical protein
MDSRSIEQAIGIVMFFIFKPPLVMYIWLLVESRTPGPLCMRTPVPIWVDGLQDLKGVVIRQCMTLVHTPAKLAVLHNMLSIVRMIAVMLK